MRKALGTLPWVEHGTIQFDYKKEEVRFNLKDKSKFNEEDMKKALAEQKFPGATVKSGPR